MGPGFRRDDVGLRDDVSLRRWHGPCPSAPGIPLRLLRSRVPLRGAEGECFGFGLARLRLEFAMGGCGWRAVIGYRGFLDSNCRET